MKRNDLIEKLQSFPENSVVVVLSDQGVVSINGFSVDVLPVESLIYLDIRPDAARPKPQDRRNDP